MEKKAARSFFILSPFLVLAVTQATAIPAGRYLGARVYIPIIMIFWIVIFSHMLINMTNMGIPIWLDIVRPP